MTSIQKLSSSLILAAAFAGVPLFSLAADAPQGITAAGDAQARGQAALDKAVAYLKSQQKPDGSWQAAGQPPALTAIVLRALAGQPGADQNDPVLKKGFDKLVSFQLQNGGIYKDSLANYNTAISISALAATKDPAYKPNLEKAVEYLKSLQWTDKITGLPKGEQVDEKNPNLGGWGYGGKTSRADGSNMQTALDALHDAGLTKDDPAFKNAVKFMTRMQNLSETNDQPWPSDNGGFVYTPGNNGESQAGEYTDSSGKRLLRSYGSMTYAGLKSMIYAGLSKDDPRVKAAWGWIAKNYTVDENPGMKENKPEFAQSGVYYYYHTMARALRAYGEPIITDAQGNKHDWRVDLLNKLPTLQKPDGSYMGEKRFMETNPILATSFAALAIEEALADLKEHPVK